MKLQQASSKYRDKLVIALNKAALGERKLNGIKKEMFICDVADHVYFCNLILFGYPKKAFKFWENLDTQSRESVPNYILNELFKIVED